jgi:aminomethyltransferase
VIRKTPLYEAHVRLGARLADFAGWRMPIAYGSQIEEHHAVRRNAGAFDVSHMAISDLEGRDAAPFLALLLANDIAKLDAPGKALYTCMLREDGGILDDLLVYFLGADRYRLVTNASTRAKNLAWIRARASGRRVVIRERTDLALIAVQGPNARELGAAVLPEPSRCLKLGAFQGAELGEWYVSRTGYTGEDGFEIMLPATSATDLWDALLGRRVAACGLGARDTLRLEAGLNLYGAEMDESVTPLECGLHWTVALAGTRDFIGRAAVEQRRREGVAVERAGLVLEGGGVLRAGYPVLTSRGEGVITSGSFSPTLSRSIALARVPVGASAECEALIRGRRMPVRMVKPPFVRRAVAARASSQGVAHE